MNEKTYKVLQVFASLNVGGAETRMMDVYRNLDKSLINFDFVTMNSLNDFYCKEILDAGGNVFLVSNPRKSKFTKFRKELKKILLENNYDAIHVHTSYFSGFVCAIAFECKVKIRITHSRTTSSKNQSLKSKCQIFIGKKLIRVFSNRYISISKSAAVFLFGKKMVKKGKVKVINNAIDLKRFYQIDFIDEKLLQEINNHIVITHVGRFSNMKNHNFIIDVFFEFLKINSNSKLILVGIGEEMDRIRNKVKELGISNSVIFLGVRKDICFILRNSNIFIFPSFFEGLGGAIIEAQACGIPCLISDLIPEEVDVNMNLIKRLSLNQSASEWANELNMLKYSKINNFDYIEKKLIENKYVVEEEIKELLDIYFS